MKDQSWSDVYEMIKSCDSFLRNLLIEDILFTLKDYQQCIKKGLPFFRKEELDQIDKKYPDGMSWSDIENELCKKGILLKRATFRKWVQQGIIPASKIYEITDKGRVLRYPPKVIAHINFYKYIQYNKKSAILEILKALSGRKVSAMEMIKNMLEKEAYLPEQDYFEAALFDFLLEKHQLLPQLIQKVFRNNKEKVKVLRMLDDLKNTFKAELLPKINELKKLLNSVLIEAELGISDTILNKEKVKNESKRSIHSI